MPVTRRVVRQPIRSPFNSTDSPCQVLPRLIIEAYIDKDIYSPLPTATYEFIRFLLRITMVGEFQAKQFFM